MRRPKYLSNTSKTIFHEDRKLFYVRYISDNKVERPPQTKPMSAGSAFDAFVKAELDDTQDFDELFKKQVEEHNREWAYDMGLHVFNCYKVSGMYSRLEDRLADAHSVKCEYGVNGVVDGVPLFGYPDLVAEFDDHREVFDWKVQGTCTKTSVSPAKGYGICLDGFVGKKQTRSHQKAHKNVAQNIEDSDPKWAEQLQTYAWCIGDDKPYKFCIHQAVCKAMKEGDPQLRFSEYYGSIRKSFSDLLQRKYRECWDCVESGKFFDNPKVQEELDELADMLASGGMDARIAKERMRF